jgi:hypothetical protein
MRQHYDITNDIYYRKQRNSLIREIIASLILAGAIGIPFAIYFWRM